MPDKVFRILLKADASGAKRGAREAETALGRVQSRLASVAKVGGLVAASMAVLFVKKAIQAAIEQERVLALVESQLKATGNAAGTSTQELARYAAELQRMTGIGDEATLKMSAMLLSFKQLGGPVLKDTIATAQDVATVMGTDMQTAALMLAKALADPVSRLGELSRSGVVFTQAQKDVIKALVESGQLLEAQKMILAEIQSQYGGAAKAARNTLGGAIKALGSEWGDLHEKIILDTGAKNPIRIFVEGAIKALQYLNANFYKMGVGIEAFFAQLKLWAADALEVLWRVVKFLDEAGLSGHGPWAMSAEKLKDSIDELRRTGINSMVDAMRALSGATDEVNVPMVALAENLEEAGTAADTAENKFDDLRQVFESMLADIEALNEALKDVTDVAGIKELPTKGLFGPEDLPTAEETFGDPGAWHKIGQTAKDQLTPAFVSSMTIGIVQALASGDTQRALEQFAVAAGSIIGAAIGGAYGGPQGSQVGAQIGGTIGAIIASLFAGGGPGQTSAVLGFGPGASTDASGQRLTQFNRQLADLNRLLAELSRTIGGTIELTQSFEIAIKENGEAWLRLFDSAGELISSEAMPSFEAALKAGLEHVFSTALIDVEGPLGDAIAELFSQAATRGLDQTLRDIETVATAFASIDQALGNFNLASDPALKQLKDLAFALEQMGLSAEALAPIMERIAQAEEERMDALRTDALGRLVSLLEQAGVEGEQATRLRMEYEQKIFEVSVQKLKLELQALDMWDRKTRRLIAALEEFALDPTNFKIDLSTSGIVDVHIREDDTRRDRIDFMKSVIAESQKRLRLVSGQETEWMQEIAAILAGVGGVTEDLEIRKEIIRLLKEQRATEIEGILLRYVQEDAKYSEQYRRWQEAQIRLEFEKLKLDLQAAGAWAELADLWSDALGAALDQLDEVIDDLDNAISDFDAAIQNLLDYRQSLITGSVSPIPLREQLTFAQTQFQELLSKAMAGDVDAINALPGAANTLLDIARRMFGSTAGFDRIFGDVLRALDDVLGTGGVLPQQVPAGDLFVGDAIDRTTEEIKTQTDMVVSELQLLRGEQERHRTLLSTISTNVSGIKQELALANAVN